MYIYYCIYVISQIVINSKVAAISWEGDSLEVLKSFSRNIKSNLGAELRRLQKEKLPLHLRSMKSIGKGVFELKDQDEKSWYRCIDLSKIGNTIYVLHAFKKNTVKTKKLDLNMAKIRLKKVLLRLRKI